jgi:uncharacterized protein YbcI
LRTTRFKKHLQEPSVDRPDRQENPAARGALISQLSREIVQLHARLYGRGPTKARSYLQNDYAICILEEIFTTAERTLIGAGSSEHVRETRKKFQEAVREEFIDVVERVTGRSVKVSLSQVDIDANLALEFFIFAEQEDLDRDVGVDVNNT